MIILGLILIWAAGTGSSLIDMFDRGPGYVATNVALTFDSAVAAPESTIVKYDFEHTDDIQTLYIESGCDSGDRCKIGVSRYGKCEGILRARWEFYMGLWLDITSRAEQVSRCIWTLGGDCDKKEPDSKAHLEAVLEQLQYATYRRSPSTHYKHGDNKIELDWDLCDTFLFKFSDVFSDEHYYMNPKNIQLIRTPGNVRVGVD